MSNMYALLLLCIVCVQLTTACNATVKYCVEVGELSFYNVTETWTEGMFSEWMVMLPFIHLIITIFSYPFLVSITTTMLPSAFFPNILLGDEVCKLVKEPPSQENQFYKLFDKPKDHCYQFLMVTSLYNKKYNTAHTQGMYLITLL